MFSYAAMETLTCAWQTNLLLLYPLPHPLEEGYFCFVLLLEVYYRLKGGSLKRRDLEHPAV